jgi:Ca2+-dependent lipid-binding protein
MDSNGKSDPYVKILFDGKQMGRTKKVANTLNAEYNEGIYINLKLKLLIQYKTIQYNAIE